MGHFLAGTEGSKTLEQKNAPSWVTKAEEHYSAAYVGCYDLPTRGGPFYVFYVRSPNRALGHDNYFGLFDVPASANKWTTYITNAKTIRDAKFTAKKLPSEKFLVSRYRHDYVTAEGCMLDGGLAYVRSNGCGPAHIMAVFGDQEIFFPYLPFSTSPIPRPGAIYKDKATRRTLTPRHIRVIRVLRNVDFEFAGVLVQTCAIRNGEAVPGEMAVRSRLTEMNPETFSNFEFVRQDDDIWY